MTTPLILFCDVETTGLDPEKHGIVQIAGILCRRDENGALEEIDSFDWLCRPHSGVLVSKEALGVNGRTIEEIRGFEDPVETHRRFVTMLGRYVDKFDRADKMFFAGYNAQFDANFVRSWFRRCDDGYFGSWFHTPAIDVMTLAGVRLMRDRPTMANFKLPTVAQKLGVSLEHAHDALSDIRATKAIFEVCMVARAA